MKKGFRKVILIFLILSMMFSFIFAIKVNANETSNNNTNLNNIVSSNIDYEHDEIKYDCVTLKKYPVYSDSVIGYVDLIVEGNEINENLAGFSGTIYGYNVDFYNGLSNNKFLTDGWKITSSYSESNTQQDSLSYISFTAEKNDMNLQGNKATLRIYYYINENATNTNTCIGFGNKSGYTKFVITDAYNNTSNPLANLGNDNQMWLGIKRTEKSAVELKEEILEDKKAIMNEEYDALLEQNVEVLYIKLDLGENEENQTLKTFDQLFNALNINFEEDFSIQLAYGDEDSIALKYSNDEWEISYVSDNMVDNYQEGKINLNEIDINHLSSIEIFDDVKSSYIKLNEIGDIWQDNTSKGDCINVNDVAALRKAMVDTDNPNNIKYNEKFVEKNADVNFSDSLTIGDLMNLRYRVVNGKWKKNSN